MLILPCYPNPKIQDRHPIVDFVFLGNLGKAQNLIALLRAVEKIKHVPNFKVHFVGEGSCLEEMKRFVQITAI